MKILGGSNVEVERARHSKLDGGRARELGNDNTRMRPEHASKRLAPTLWLSEQIEQLRLLFRAVVAPRSFDLNLTPDSRGVDDFVRHSIFHAHLKTKRRNSRKGNYRRVLDLEIEVRHRYSRLLRRLWFADRQRSCRFSAKLRFPPRIPANCSESSRPAGSIHRSARHNTPLH